jgi:hypothetical protein
MFIICHVVWAVWIADGIHYFINVIESSTHNEWQGRFSNIIGQRVKQVRWDIFAVLLPIAALWVNFSYADLSSFTRSRDTYPRIMASFEPNALVLAWWGDASPMTYYQQVEKLRPDVQVVDRFLISPEHENWLIDSSLPRRPVYVFEGVVREVPHHKDELPAFGGTIFKAYKIIPPD